MASRTSKMSVGTKQVFTTVWNFKQVWVDLGTHVNVLRDIFKKQSFYFPFYSTVIIIKESSSNYKLEAL